MFDSKYVTDESSNRQNEYMEQLVNIMNHEDVM